MSRTVVDYATLAVDAAVGLDDASPQITGLTPHPKWMMATVETDQIRYRDDGTDPTSSEGHLLNVGDTLQYMEGDEQDNWKAFLRSGKLRFIKVTSAAALKITYYV